MTIHAFTELHNNFPAYINLSEQPDGTIKVSVRTRGNDGKDYATITLTALQAEELADSIYKHNYKGECEIDLVSRAAPVPASEAASEQSLPQSECNATLRAAPAGLLNADELAALQRFDECAQDGEGYDVPKDMMQRLAEIGVVQRRSGAYYQATVFGRQVLGNAIPAPSIKEMVNNFLGWRLPADFSPDCGIGFDGRKDDEWNKNKTWPIGTNLLNADQARAMFEYVLAPRFRAEGGITNGSTTNLAAPTAPTDAKPATCRLTEQKTDHIMERDGFQKVGYVLQKPGGDYCLSAQSAVRWLDQKEYWRLMHEQDGSLFANPAAQSVRDAALEEAARNVEDFQADNGEVSFNDIALSIRALIQSPQPGEA